MVSFCGMRFQLIGWVWAFDLVQFSSLWLSSLDARMRTRGLVLLLFVAQTTWFGIPNFCNAKGEWVEHGIEDLVLLIHLK